MRVLLHDTRTDRYFQSLESWTHDPGLAADLGGTVRAVNLAFDYQLQGMEIVLAFDEAHLRMCLPLQIGQATV